MKKLVLKVEKGDGIYTIHCENEELVLRYKRRGYKLVPYVEETKKEEYPF